MNDYACVQKGPMLCAAQQQAALADEQPGFGKTAEGWSICASWLAGALVRGRPTCPVCLAECEKHEKRKATGELLALPLRGLARAKAQASIEALVGVEGVPVIVSAAQVDELLGGGTEAADVVREYLAEPAHATTEAWTEEQAEDAELRERRARAAVKAAAKAPDSVKLDAKPAAAPSADAAEQMIENLLRSSPQLRNQAIVDSVRAVGLKASFGRVDKARERLGVAEPAKPVKGAPAAVKAPAKACTPECQAGGAPCSPECAAELGLA